MTLPLEPTRTHLVPPRCPIAVPVVGNVLFPSVQRPVWRNVSHVQKERLVLLETLLQKADGVIVQRIGQVEVVGEFVPLAVNVVGISLDLVKVADLRLAHRPEESIKASIQSRVTPLPFTNNRGVVAGLLQHLTDGDALLEVLGFIPAIAPVPDLLAVQPRQKRGPSRTTDRVVVELREPQSVPRQGINVGCVNFAAIAADV